MDWKKFWNRTARKRNVHEQVGRVSRRPVDDRMLDRIAEYIAGQIELSPTDRLLDVCCGNGLITGRLASKCRAAVGVDFSAVLIQKAIHSDWPKTEFIRGDALHLPEYAEGSFDKIICFFSFQYFDTYKKGIRLLENMKELLAADGLIYLGDIPDQNRKHKFFPNLFSRMKYEIGSRLKIHPMGTFWRVDTLDKMAASVGMKGRYIEQPEDLLYAHYRFDYILEQTPDS